MVTGIQQRLLEQQTGLDTVQLVLAVDVLGEGGLAPQQDPEHEVEPHAAGKDLQPGSVVLDGLQGQVLPHGSQPVEEEVVEVLEAAGVQPHPEDGGQEVPDTVLQSDQRPDLLDRGRGLTCCRSAVLLHQLQTQLGRKRDKTPQDTTYYSSTSSDSSLWTILSLLLSLTSLLGQNSLQSPATLFSIILYSLLNV